MAIDPKNWRSGPTLDDLAKGAELRVDPAISRARESARSAGTLPKEAPAGLSVEALRLLAQRLGLADGWTAADVFAALETLPNAPQPEGAVTGWFSITHKDGTELVRVFGPEGADALEEARRFSYVRRAEREGGGLAYRRMRTTQLQPAPVWEAPQAYGIEIEGARYVVRPAIVPGTFHAGWGVVPLDGGPAMVDGRALPEDAEQDARQDAESLRRALGQ